VSDTVRYRYGFNGKERDPATEWGQTSYDYGFRIYNPEIAKFLSVDPLTKDYPWYTPYQFAGNTPIQAIDLDGLEEIYYDESINRGGFKLAVYILTNAGLMEEFKENFQMENNEFDLYLISRRLNTSIDIDQGEVKQGTLAQTHMRPIKLQGEGAEYVELEKQNIRSLYKNNLNEDKVYEQTLSKGKGALVVEISEELFDMIEKNMNNPSTRESSLNLLEITAETIIHELSLHVLDAKNENKYYFSNGKEDKRGVFAHMYYYNLDKPSTHSPKYSEIKNNSTAGKNKEKIKIQVDILRDKKSRPIKVD
jgi:RHS repeat-associated protein